MTLKISQMMDGQLETGEFEAVLQSATSDPALRDRLTVYGLIGDSLRGNSTPDDGFTVRILQRMRERAVRIEPGYDPLAE